MPLRITSLPLVSIVMRWASTSAVCLSASCISSRYLQVLRAA